MANDKCFALHIYNKDVIKGQDYDLKISLAKEFQDQENKKIILSFLSDIYFLKRGLISNPHVNPSAIFFNDPDSGFLHLHYEVEYALGCSDSSINETDYKKFNFHIDRVENKLILKLDDIPERQPDEI